MSQQGLDVPQDELCVHHHRYAHCVVGSLGVRLGLGLLPEQGLVWVLPLVAQVLAQALWPVLRWRFLRLSGELHAVAVHGSTLLALPATWPDGVLLLHVQRFLLVSKSRQQKPVSPAHSSVGLLILPV